MLFSRFKTVFLFSLILSALFLTAGCGSKDVPPPDPDAIKNALIGKVWVCKSLFERTVHDDSKLTLEFMADGTVKGHGGCNEFGGGYTLAGDTLKFGPMQSTRMACSPATDEQEFTYLSFLPLINRVVVEEDELELHSNSAGEPMRFVVEGSSSLW